MLSACIHDIVCKASLWLTTLCRLVIVCFVFRLDFVDLIVQGYVFRLKIFYEKEVVVRRADEKTRKSFPAAIPVMTVQQMEREFIAEPLLINHLRSIQDQHVAFGPVCRIAKRWLAAHLFSPYLTPIAIELLVAYTFLQPLPYTPVTAAGALIQGLHRFLQLLSTFDWQSTPLIVDLTADMKPEDVDAITSKFQQSRSKGLGAAMYIATAQDRESTLYTADTPHTVMLQRVSKLHTLHISRSAAAPDVLTNIAEI